MNEEPITVTFLVIEVLEKLGIRYLISGSLASAIYGEPRATRGADLLADIKPNHAQQLFEMLEPEFNVSIEAIRNAIDNRSSFNLIHYKSLFKVDVFVPKNRFDEQELERRALHLVARHPEKSAYVASAEDVILAKLDWYRLGNEISDQQWRDVVGIFKANQGSLDVQYMKSTAEGLRVLDLLLRLL
ncbi:MAG: hypothetical protein K2X93_19305 [Candidatus Obscuribacterales bacterium]|nr:hypothetical protein [Candidatus Obscuribacterales bacterium]